MTTMAQRVSALFDDDGMVKESNSGDSLYMEALHLEAEAHWGLGGVSKYVFPDGSSIVEAEDGTWDFGCSESPGCFCWASMGCRCGGEE